MSDFVFVPTKEQTESSNLFFFMKKYNINSLSDLLEKAKKDPDWYWQAVDNDIGIFWHQKYHTVSDFKRGKPWAKWFIGGTTNIYFSGVEKFSKKIPNKLAYVFLSEDGHERKITYSELDKEVSKLANGLKSAGVGRGDVVAIYMPMIPEAVFAILACAKIGAVQTVIFSGYSTESLKIRLQDCQAKILFTSDGYTRKGKPISQKRTVVGSIKNSKIEKTIVVDYKGIDRYEENDSFVYYPNLISKQSSSCKTEIMDSESPLFILYTSGTTGKPKGCLHTHGGFSVFAGHQSAYLIDAKQDDVLFWPADIGWITGLTWNVYGLLETGSTAIIYDGAIDWPDINRTWKMIQDYKVTILGTSPTAIRMFKQEKINPLLSFDLSSIRIMTTTGEPLDEESWWWLFENVGNKKIPIMNLSGGTEIGGAFLSVLPGMNLKPSTVGVPCPGIDADVFDDNGTPIRIKKGFVVIKRPWPSMTRSLLNDDSRYFQTYWSRFSEIWFHGDFASIDEDGLWYLHGRVDDIINVAGHRLSTAEIEECIISHSQVVEAASIPVPDPIKGDAIVAFVVLNSDLKKDQNLEDELKEYVSQKIGKVAKPKTIKILSELPKTRTGKIVRRVLKAKLLGEPLGDLSSLENPHVLDQI